MLFKSNTVVVKLQGGLGNQMFQYAVARALTNDGNIYFDHSFLESNNVDTREFTARPYELLIFKNIEAGEARPWHSDIFRSHAIFYRVIRRLFQPFIKYIRQNENEPVDIPRFSTGGYLYLDGYFQSERYFEDKRDIIIQQFTFPELDSANETLGSKIKATENSVSIHIRRADYVGKKAVADVHGVLPVTYYHKALEILAERNGKLGLFIFSDDLNWVKANFKFPGNDVCFVENNYGPDSWKDMALMSLCRQHVIANSSFSWWAAWLNADPGKVVISPADWFRKPEFNEQSAFIIPQTWIRI